MGLRGSDVVTENQRSVPWTVMVATWSMPPDTPGTLAERPIGRTRPGERSSTMSEQLPFWHEPTQGEGVPAARAEGQQLPPCEESRLRPLLTAVMGVPELASPAPVANA